MSEATQEKITPTVAKMLLEKNTGNRTVSSERVAQYARDMKAGNWSLTGETIKIAHDGRIIDGQHRLMAAALASVSFETFVVRGLDPKVQKDVDSGLARSNANVATMMGYGYATDLSSAATLGFNLEHRSNIHTLSGTTRASHSEFVKWVEENESIVDYMPLAKRISRVARLGTGPIALVILYAVYQDGEDALPWFEELSDFATSGRGDPRAALLRRTEQVRNSNTSLKQFQKFYLLARAYEAFRAGESLDRIPIFDSRGGMRIPAWVYRAIRNHKNPSV